MALPTTDQLQKARLQAEQAKARYQALQGRVNEAARKQETRRKIILGGLLIDAAEKDEKFARVVQVLVARIGRDQDLKAFDGWETPKPPHEGTGPEQALAPIGSTLPFPS